MNRIRLFSALAFAVPATLGVSFANAAPGGHVPGRHIDVHGRAVQEGCPRELTPKGHFRCMHHRILGEAEEVTPEALSLSPQAATCDATQGQYAAFQPWMLGATQISDLYSLTGTGTVAGNAPIVAIVDAAGYSMALTDINAYRAQFGMSPLAQCSGSVPSGATPCFAAVDQTGGTNMPADDLAGWTGEAALDVDMVTAACPNCSILYVAAATASSDLNTALNYAASVPGVVAISNSWGGTESSADSAGDQAAYSHPGILITAASGDQDYDNEGLNKTNGDTPAAPNYPASSPYVLSVGGTTPSAGTGARGYQETVWNWGLLWNQGAAGQPTYAAAGGGSGCSTVFAKPAWQTASLGTCTKRASTDVSAAADWTSAVPNLNDAGVQKVTDAGKPRFKGGVGVYENGCWQPVGGTSAATPLVSAIFARYGWATTLAASGGFSNIYSNAGYFYDVTTGSNDNSGKCTNSVMCNGGVGWDGPTGMGTPNGAAIATALGISSTPVTPKDAGVDSTTPPPPQDAGHPTHDGSVTPPVDASIQPGTDSGPPPPPPSGDSGAPNSGGDSGAPNSGGDAGSGNHGGNNSGGGCAMGGGAPASGFAAGLLFGLVALASRRRNRAS